MTIHSLQNRTSPIASTTLSSLAAAVLLLAGCAENPADKSTAADVKPATPLTPAASTTPQPGARVFTFSENSAISFTGSKVTGKHEGGFKKFTGQFSVNGNALSAAGSKVVIDMDSTWADNEKLTGHLKAPDFFDVTKFPQSTFELTSVENAEAGKVKLTGNLTLHGVTKQISFPADLNVQGDQATLKADFFIKRFDFDIKYPGRADDLIRDEVVIKLDLKAAAKG